MPNLDALDIETKTGNEPFTLNDAPLPFKLIDIWRDQYSDVLNNTTRGTIIEAVVARALGGNQCLKRDWHAYDIETKEGIKVEVKSSAYVQTWKQNDYSTISFGIAPTEGWDAETNTSSPIKKRWADVYVFCLLHHKDKPTVDPMNLDQWTFFIVPTKTLNEKRGDYETVSLKQLRDMNAVEVGFLGIGERVKQCLK